MRDDFAVFILSHGRSDRVYTLKPLQLGKYSGKWFIIIDDEDDQADEYKRIYGDHVVQFSKAAYDDKFDIMDLHTDRRVVVYARNACFDIAKQLGVRYFLVLDDDYNSFQYRYPECNSLKIAECLQLDELCEGMVEFMIQSGALSIAFAQGGDFIGGLKGGAYKKKLLRKVMNTWFCDAEKPFQIIGRINEDTNTYVYLGTQGKLFFTVTDVIITQKQTQSNAGGLTDIYLDRGTYVKSFYTVMCAPSCAKIAAMGDKHMRVHHRILWGNCTPMIISQKWRKCHK